MINPKLREAIAHASMHDKNGRRLSTRRHLELSEIQALRRQVEEGSSSAFSEGVASAVGQLVREHVRRLPPEARTVRRVTEAAVSVAQVMSKAPKALHETSSAELRQIVAETTDAPTAGVPDLTGDALIQQEADIAVSRDGSVPLDQRDAAFYRAMERFASRRGGDSSPFWAKS